MEKELLTVEETIAQHMKANGVPLTPINAVSNKYPSGSYNVAQHYEAAIKEGELTIRLFAEGYSEVMKLRKKVIDLLHTDTKAPSINDGNNVVYARLATAPAVIQAEDGIYEATIFFILNWKEGQ